MESNWNATLVSIYEILSGPDVPGKRVTRSMTKTGLSSCVEESPFDPANLPIPPKEIKANWKLFNKIGFLKGVFYHGLPVHYNEICHLLESSGASDQKSLVGQKSEINAFIDKMFDWYIRPFKRFPWDDCRSMVSWQVSSLPSDNRERIHHRFLKSLKDRDQRCLFCWGTVELRAAHLVGSQNEWIADMDALFERAEIKQIHSVENGLLLCVKCHAGVGALYMYVDTSENRFLVKYINPNGPENRVWKKRHELLVVLRKIWLEYFSDGSIAVDEDGNIPISFVSKDKSLYPSKTALDLHKTACLIWLLAGGDEDEDCCSCCDYDDYVAPSAPFAQTERIRAWNEEVAMFNQP